MGLTPDLVTGIWVGAEDRSVHFRSTSLGQGASMALPVWAIFMKKIYDDPQLKFSKGDFLKPDNMDVELDCAKFQQQQNQNKFNVDDFDK